jgi:hypothetical protein
VSLPSRPPDWRTRLAAFVVAPITPGARRAVATLFVVVLVMFGLDLLFTARQVQDSNHQWCSTLTLLTSRPVPRPSDPSANPSREQTYVLYSDFVTLRHRLGCG